MKIQLLERAITPNLRKNIKPNKVLLLYGARRVGKTELIKKYLKEIDPSKYLLLNGDDQNTIDLCSLLEAVREQAGIRFPFET